MVLFETEGSIWLRIMRNLKIIFYGNTEHPFCPSFSSYPGQSTKMDEINKNDQNGEMCSYITNAHTEPKTDTVML